MTYLTTLTYDLPVSCLYLRSQRVQAFSVFFNFGTYFHPCLTSPLLIPNSWYLLNVAKLHCLAIEWQMRMRIRDLAAQYSGAGTNLKVGGGTDPVQLVVMVSAFVMVSTVWPVYFLLFYLSRCPRAQTFVKVRGSRAPRALWIRRHCTSSYTSGEAAHAHL